MTDPVKVQPSRQISAHNSSTAAEPIVSMTHEPVSGSNITKDKIQKNHLPSIKCVEILADLQVPSSDEFVLRSLFKKFENQWSRFQKHSKLSQAYSTGRLKLLKAKIESAEALWSNKELHKKIHKKYKAFCDKYEKQPGKFESRDEEMKKFAQNFKDLDKNALKLYMKNRYPVDEGRIIYQKK